MSEPVLVAIKCDSSDERFNVWRFDTPQTECIAFNIKALSEDHAIAQCKEIIKLRG